MSRAALATRDELFAEGGGIPLYTGRRKREGAALANRPFWSRSHMPVGNNKLIGARPLASFRRCCAPCIRIAQRQRRAEQAHIFADLRFDLRRDILVLLEKVARRLAPLADAHAIEREPGA